MRWDELEAHVGEAVTLTGTALNAAGGAILSLGDHPVYVAGLRQWDDELFAQELEVRGTLVFRRSPAGPIHKRGDAYALEDATWSLAAS